MLLPSPQPHERPAAARGPGTLGSVGTTHCTLARRTSSTALGVHSLGPERPRWDIKRGGGRKENGNGCPGCPRPGPWEAPSDVPSR